MTSRLNRLLTLLDTGSTPLTRKAAAQQIGEIIKIHPHELHNLLYKVHVYVCSSSWDTRIAASQAIEAIAKNVPEWKPDPVIKEEDDVGSSDGVDKEGVDRLEFSKFDINRLMRNGASLLGSSGVEYEQPEQFLNMDLRTRLVTQKRQLCKRLGFDVGGQSLMEAGDLFNEDDLIDSHSYQNQSPNMSTADACIEEITAARPGLSIREQNRAKRKAKQFAKQKSKDSQDQITCSNGKESSAEPPVKRKRSTVNVLVEQPASVNKILIDSIPDSSLGDDVTCWPFENYCELLCQNLFNSSWEVRHGAATSLREIIKIHGQGAGKSADHTATEMETSNQGWLEDMALTLLCVLVLDRFGDYVSDEVVAPVRETCAQCLGVLLKHMSTHGVSGVLHILLQFLDQSQWEVRHGGLLGIKYMLAVRQDLTDSLLQRVLPLILQGLQDIDDDVRAVAGSALVPVADQLCQLMPQQAGPLLTILWDMLLELDDLTASTTSVLSLLAVLLSHNVTDNIINTDPTTASTSPSSLVSRLWPFLGHASSSIRRSVLQALHSVLDSIRDKGNSGAVYWLTSILQEAVRHVFQQAIIEDHETVLTLIPKVWSGLVSQSDREDVLVASCPWISIWLCLMMHPSKLPIDQQYLIIAEHPRNKGRSVHRTSTGDPAPAPVETSHYIGGAGSLNGPTDERDVIITRSRILAARLLGGLLPSIAQPGKVEVLGELEPLVSLEQLFKFHLDSKSALQRMAAALVVSEWALAQPDCHCPASIKSSLLHGVEESLYFDELAQLFTSMQSECQALVSSLTAIGCDTSTLHNGVYTIEQANALASSQYTDLLTDVHPAVTQNADMMRSQLLVTITQVSSEFQLHTLRVQSVLASALVSLKSLPAKLNPIIRPLMETTKREENTQLQEYAVCSLTRLLVQCVERSPCPNPKILKNLCTFISSNSQTTPQVSNHTPGTNVTSSNDSTNDAPAASGDIILTLTNQTKMTSSNSRRGIVFRKQTSADSTVSDASSTLEPVSGARSDLSADHETQKLINIQCKGGELAIRTIAEQLKSYLFKQLPALYDIMCSHLSNIHSVTEQSLNEKQMQDLVNSLRIIEVIFPSIDSSLHDQVTSLLPRLLICLSHTNHAVRHMASRCLAVMGKVIPDQIISYVLENVLPMVGDSASLVKRLGAIETLYNLVDRLDFDVVPYVALLIVPVLGRMADQHESIRLMASQCFAAIVKLMPLEVGVEDPPSMSAAMKEQKKTQRRFLQQLLDNSQIEPYTIPIPIHAELRKYQQDGVNWLSFLNKYKLHGILCDDMGLGKTLQSICLIAGDHFNRALAQYKDSKRDDCCKLPSIVICPPTLTGHWVYEIEKFIDKKFLKPLHYTGAPIERHRLQKKVSSHDVVIASYDIVRNDIDFFSTVSWNYCILDEGHIIKNGKTKISKAVKQLMSNHRLILTGTPIQNNVVELWSLFDFLMPGFLGSEQQFFIRYGRPILQSRDAKSSSKDQEQGVLAMEALHRQVLPFLLRRLKEDVLQDLPPKIIQDFYCDLSPLQMQLYEDFAKSQAKKGIDSTMVKLSADDKPNTSSSGSQGATHIFQALQYLKKVCNHPALVLTSEHPELTRMMSYLKSQNSDLHDIQHAPKLVGLRQLLQDCGIGCDISSNTSSSDVNTVCEEPVVSQHRVLLFCQLKSMLDIIETDLLNRHMPSVTYLRLDGTVPANSRVGLVNRFNNDPSIDILLLTTHVGGLGLNLTGADTVIFVEHDWNPMKDLQAMDRAHRIGQKKVVNVYRLITRGTLEEKIMGLQKFKLNIANSVITEDNSSLRTMNTEQVLDLFNTVGTSTASSNSDESKPKKGKSGLAGVLENLDSLWDETQYDAEYDLSNFMQSLK